MSVFGALFMMSRLWTLLDRVCCINRNRC